MKNVVIGQYVPGKGFFYRIDPRTKILAVIVLMVAVFLLETVWQVLIGLGISLLFVMGGNISVRRIVRGLKPLYVLLLFTVFFNVAFNRAGTDLLAFYGIPQAMHVTPWTLGFAVLATVLWRFLASFRRLRFLLLLAWLLGLYFLFAFAGFGPEWAVWQLKIYDQGISSSVFVLLRLLIVITLSTVLTLTTKPTDLTQALESLLRPLRVVGIRSEEFALIISISLRYIPTILDEANKIMAAQASRGADFAQGKLKAKVIQAVSLLVPMFIIAFKRSEDLADAMESRNFIPGRTRTRIHELRFNYRDLVAGFLTAACLAAAILVKVL